jgi:hypothetical protein
LGGMLSDKYSLRDTGLISAKSNFVMGHVKRTRTDSKSFRPTPSAVAANMDTDELFPKSTLHPHPPPFIELKLTEAQVL